MRVENGGETVVARWLPLACFAVAVGSTLSVLVLQALALGSSTEMALARIPGWIGAWIGFTALIAAGAAAGVFRMRVGAASFHSAHVQEVTLILMGALIAMTLVILVVTGGGWLWGSASMIMAAAGLIPLLAIRLRKAPAADASA